MKKFISFILCISMLCGLCCVVQAKQEIDFGVTVTDTISENNTENKYSFDVTYSGKVSLDFTAENIEAVNLQLYDESGQEIWSDMPWWNSTSKQISFSKDLELTAGSYSLVVSERSGRGTYDIELNFDDSNESFSESQSDNNNSFKRASLIDLDENYTGQLAVNDEIDNYMFTLDSSGGFDFSYTAENIEAVNLKIYNEKGQEIWGDSPWWNSTSKQISYQNDVTLSSGTYYFIVSVYSGYGTYEFDLSIDGNQNNNGDDYDDDSNLTEDDDDYYYDDDSFQENTIKVRTSDLSIFINGEKVYFPDARPFIDSADRTQVPVRFVTETMGYEVDWHDREKIVEIYTLGVLPSTKLYIKINENYITRYYDGNGNRIYMDTTSQIVDDRTYIPLRYVAEALGYNVEWE
ncbi:MAG: copper amine oxidase N-terminal domain-containing protein [Clostridiales bacterium]|nr:copper amine oxidase N-terminal domain-containing protein [Clostridiales bacterium]